MPVFSFRSRAATQHLLTQLASQRPLTSPSTPQSPTAEAVFQFDKTDWVPLWMDPEHAVRSACGTATAYRAITKRGQLLWYVFAEGKSRGYHALTDCPFEAIEEAAHSRAARRAVRARWAEVEALALDLRKGRKTFDVRIEDAHASPLCTLGIEGFCASMGLGTMPVISGRFAAWLMRIEPQLGFVIDAAWQRHQNDATARSLSETCSETA